MPVINVSYDQPEPRVFDVNFGNLTASGFMSIPAYCLGTHQLEVWMIRQYDGARIDPIMPMPNPTTGTWSADFNATDMDLDGSHQLVVRLTVMDGTRRYAASDQVIIEVIGN